MYQLKEIKTTEFFQDNFQNWKKHIFKFIRNPKLKEYESFFSDKKIDHIYDVSNSQKSTLINKNLDLFSEKKFTSNKLKNRMLNELFYEITPVILHEDDQNSMMHSIENRSPFLDTNIFDLALSLPSHYYIKNGYNKYVLRESMKGILVDDVRLDRKKKGFNSSIDNLINFKSKKNFDFILDSNSKIFNIVDYKKIEKKILKNELENVDSKFIFSFLSCKSFIDQFG